MRKILDTTNFEDACATLAVMAQAYIMAGPAVNVAPRYYLAIFMAAFQELYCNHGQYQNFYFLIREGIPNIDEIVQWYKCGFSSYSSL